MNIRPSAHDSERTAANAYWMWISKGSCKIDGQPKCIESPPAFQ